MSRAWPGMTQKEQRLLQPSWTLRFGPGLVRVWRRRAATASSEWAKVSSTKICAEDLVKTASGIKVGATAPRGFFARLICGVSGFVAGTVADYCVHTFR